MKTTEKVKTPKEIEEQISKITEVSEYWNHKELDLYTREDYEKGFKEIITRRLQHCSANLEEHLHEAKKTPMGLIVFWEDKHFSLPVYEALIEALNQKMEDWNALIWQQILRQMFDEDNRDRHLFYYASEMLLCKPLEEQ